MSNELSQLSKERLVRVVREQEKETFDLVAKVVELINELGWDPDDSYTFIDGDRWYKFNPDEEGQDNE
jgi:hypothetical protein